MSKLYLFHVPTLYEAKWILRATVDSDLSSVKSLTKVDPIYPSFSTLVVFGWVFVIAQAVIL